MELRTAETHPLPSQDTLEQVYHLIILLLLILTQYFITIIRTRPAPLHGSLEGCTTPPVYGAS